MARPVLTQRYLLFAGTDSGAKGWHNYIREGKYDFTMIGFIPKGCTWYQIIDMETKQIIVDYDESPGQLEEGNKDEV